MCVALEIYYMVAINGDRAGVSVHCTWRSMIYWNNCLCVCLYVAVWCTIWIESIVFLYLISVCNCLFISHQSNNLSFSGAVWLYDIYVSLEGRRLYVLCSHKRDHLYIHVYFVFHFFFYEPYKLKLDQNREWLVSLFKRKKKLVLRILPKMLWW